MRSRTFGVGYTSGVFDLFHVGHLNLLQRAKGQCEKLIVGVTAGDLVARRKGRFPVIPIEERMAIVEGLSCVDRVVVQETMDKMQAWERYRFNAMFVGDDWKGTPTWDEWERRFEAIGVPIVYFPYTRHVSSTKIRKEIEAGEHARKLHEKVRS